MPLQKIQTFLAELPREYVVLWFLGVALLVLYKVSCPAGLCIVVVGISYSFNRRLRRQLIFHT